MLAATVLSNWQVQPGWQSLLVPLQSVAVAVGGAALHVDIPAVAEEDGDADNYTADAVPGDNTVDSARAVVGSGQVAAGNIVVAEHGIGAEEGHAHCIRQQWTVAVVVALG